MKFGDFPLSEAEGIILAHSKKIEGGVVKKGTRLTADHIGQLAAAGYDTILGAQLEPGDIGEDEAATALAEALVGDGVTLSRATTGRVNVHAKRDGIAVVDHDRIHRINMLDERITVATVRPYTSTVHKQLLATVKIIPYAVPDFSLERTIEVATLMGPCVDVASFEERSVGLLMTRLTDAEDKLLAKGERVTRERLKRFGDGLQHVETVPHDRKAIAEAMQKLAGLRLDIVLVLSASAIVDRGDIVPSALDMAGGRITQFGMPVDPGNLLLLGEIGETHVVGIPGCARSIALNGFDWVLERLHAGLKVGTRDISRMGVGGLLKEIPSRPQLRDAPPARAEANGERPKVYALVLAAGQSRRMGPRNKLLELLDDKPVVGHVVEAARAAHLAGILVVTGHEAARVQVALDGQDVTFVHNPDYVRGLSTSLKRGLASLPDDADGVLICLGDMPFVTAEELDMLSDAFAASGPQSICIPTVHGKAGNPVLLPRSLFGEVLSLDGDVGAKGVIEQHQDAIVRVDLSTSAALTDIDTEDMLAAAREGIQSSDDPDKTR